MQPPAESPKHQKIDKNSLGSNNVMNAGPVGSSGGSTVGMGGIGGLGGLGGIGGMGGMGAMGGPGSSATLPAGSHSHSLPLGSVEAQLKYENDRLKLALAQRYVTDHSNGNANRPNLT